MPGRMIFVLTLITSFFERLIFKGGQTSKTLPDMERKNVLLQAREYLTILESELLLALGCTEPIAIALCAAKGREILGKMPEKAEVFCSANVIKNTHSVTVPNSGGKKGFLSQQL